MAQMFAAVEGRLRAAGIGPVLRIQYGAPPEQPAPADAAIAFLPQPTETPPTIRGRFQEQWRRMRGEMAFESRCAESEGNSGPPFQLLMEGYYHWTLDQQAEHLVVAGAMLDHVRPELVVVGNDRWWPGQAFVRLARARGIPTLCVQDGVAGDVPYWYWMTSDRLAASGDFLARILARHGFSSPQCVVTGQPRYDTLWSQQGSDTMRSARERLGLDARAFYVLFATQPMLDHSYQQQVVRSVLAVPDARMLFRPHPSQPPASYRDLVEDLPAERLCVQRAADIFDLVLAANVLITHSSTVVLEAAIVKRPVITANFTGLPDLVPFAALGLATDAPTPAALTAIVGQLASAHREHLASATSHRVERALADLVGPADGLAGERVAALIREMLDGPRPVS
jgi:hypothetical protein